MVSCQSRILVPGFSKICLSCFANLDPELKATIILIPELSCPSEGFPVREVHWGKRQLRPQGKNTHAGFAVLLAGACLPLCRSSERLGLVLEGLSSPCAPCLNFVTAVEECKGESMQWLHVLNCFAFKAERGLPCRLLGGAGVFLLPRTDSPRGWQFQPDGMSFPQAISLFFLLDCQVRSGSPHLLCRWMCCIRVRILPWPLSCERMMAAQQGHYCCLLSPKCDIVFGRWRRRGFTESVSVTGPDGTQPEQKPFRAVGLGSFPLKGHHGSQTLKALHLAIPLHPPPGICCLPHLLPLVCEIELCSCLALVSRVRTPSWWPTSYQKGIWFCLQYNGHPLLHARLLGCKGMMGKPWDWHLISEPLCHRLHPPFWPGVLIALCFSS